ncbi:MAG: hypothetical protein H6Q40_464 [Deltaproteobacteria bacterium]|nr:hypothetical protein [Deltaproteobacteria bacterium]
MLAAVLKVVLKNDGLGILYCPNLRPFIIDLIFKDASFNLLSNQCDSVNTGIGQEWKESSRVNNL